MRKIIMEKESKEFKDIITSANLAKLVAYMSLAELDREIKKSYFKGKINEEKYNKWTTWDEDTKIIALRRFIFYYIRAL